MTGEDEKEGPSTGSGRTEVGPVGPVAPAGPGEAGALDGMAIRPGKGREMQFVRAPRRKLFKRAAQEVFLEWFAATGNCVFSAAKAGFCHKTIWKHRIKDPEFRAAFDLALDQGIVRAKASLIEMKAKAGPIRIDGDLDAVELEEPDPQIVLHLVREHERARAGVRKTGRAPRVASDAEVDAALKKRLAAYSNRVRGVGSSAKSDGAAVEAGQREKGPLHHPSDGPPPREISGRTEE